MKEMKEKFLVIIATLVIIALIPICSYGTFSAKVTITPDKEIVSAGDTVTLTVKFEDIVDVGEGINVLGGYFTYDTDFFESPEGISPNEDNNGKFAIMKTDGSAVTTSNDTFATFKIKVKSNATGTGNLIFEGLEFSNSDEDYQMEDPIEIAISIEDNNDEQNNIIENNNVIDYNQNENNYIYNDIYNDNNYNYTNNVYNEYNNYLDENVYNNVYNNESNEYQVDQYNNTPKTNNSSSKTNQIQGKTDPSTANKIIPNAGLRKGIILAIVILIAGGAYKFYALNKYKDI